MALLAYGLAACALIAILASFVCYALTLDQALAASRRLHRRHAMVVGVLPAAVGPFAEGSDYRANEVSALRWVHATLVETALLAHDLVLSALTDGEREQY